jgi:hypothetical protein
MTTQDPTQQTPKDPSIIDELEVLNEQVIDDTDSIGTDIPSD